MPECALCLPSAWNGLRSIFPIKPASLQVPLHTPAARSKLSFLPPNPHRPRSLQPLFNALCCVITAACLTNRKCRQADVREGGRDEMPLIL